MAVRFAEVKKSTGASPMDVDLDGSAFATKSKAPPTAPPAAIVPPFSAPPPVGGWAGLDRRRPKLPPSTSAKTAMPAMASPSSAAGTSSSSGGGGEGDGNDPFAEMRARLAAFDEKKQAFEAAEAEAERQLAASGLKRGDAVPLPPALPPPGMALAIQEQAQADRDAAKEERALKRKEQGDREEHARAVLRCRGCGIVVDTSSSFLLLEDADWAGTLHGECFACSKYGRALAADADAEAEAAARRQFKRAVSRSWTKHATKRMDRLRTVRTVTWANFEKHFSEVYGGLGRAFVRDLVVKRIKFAATAFAASLSQESQNLQDKAKQFCQEYLDAVEEGAANPLVADKCGAKVLCTEAVGYMNKLTEGIAVSWLCRFPDCGFYGMNSQWIRRVDAEKFRCPLCGLEYQPWSEARGQVPAQKVLSMLNPLTMETMHMPIVWPSGAEDSWLSKMVEAKAEEMVDLDIFDDAYMARNCRDIDTLVRKCGIPHFFSLQAWRDDAEWKLDERTYPPSQWQHLKEKGVYGAFLDLKDPNFTPFTDLPVLIKLLAEALAGGKQRARM